MLVETPRGSARLTVDRADRPRALLVLGHGAGGSVTAPDLAAVAAQGAAGGITVVRVEQPYRVAGRRSAPPAAHLDQAWPPAVAAARAAAGRDLPLVVGGRSSGARVAARTIAETAAVGLLALAFPLITPRGVSRQEELDAVDVPVLILQGDRDPFGVPEPARRLLVHVLAAADHTLRGAAATEAASVAVAWLLALVPEPGVAAQKL